MKKVGQVLWGIFQVFTYLLIQIIVGVIVTIGYSVIRYFQISAQGISDFNLAYEIILDDVVSSSFLMVISCLFSIVSIILYSIWYKKRYVKGKKVNLKEIFTVKQVSLIILLAVSVQVFLITFVGIIQAIKPDWFTNYNEIMKQFDIGNSWQSLIYVAILGPIVEELLMRGLVLNQMKKAMPFVAANIVQAFLFALLHGNLVQGSYAFVLGIIFGYIYRKYNTILSTILFHIVFNFSGYVIDIALSGVDLNLLMIIVISVLTLAISIFVIRLILTEKNAIPIYEAAIGKELEYINEIVDPNDIKERNETKDFIMDETVVNHDEI
ncbi:CPBP family intramembrane glutamic endopeptidase [Clostridium sp. Marseille-P299]|uniref:CPBP family intramembrane glutamic endopeptidase n=1 Tax=Clostridium sp. Marseille-P299 TaxID=1805477 RepID=UPI00083733FD|nr:CPBP family intramembrane glutamic endopeptidase [Clostridium sp. Marseille-P299]